MPTKAKLRNVVEVFKAPFTGGRVVANTPYKPLNKALELVSNNPVKTALVAGTVANVPKAVQLTKKTVAARSASKASKVVTATRSTDKPGLLDLSELGKQAPTTSAPGIIKTSQPEGGVLSRVSESLSRSPRSSPTRRRKSTKARKRKITSRRSRSKRRTSRRSKRKYGTAKQYARPGGKKVYYAKRTGQPYIILPDGRSRFVKGKRRK